MHMRIFVAALCFVPLVAQPSEKLKVCAKQGNGQAYEVEATFTDGAELNAATGSFRFTSFSKYVVIFWKQDQASVIELDFPFVSVVGTSGTDQQGRKWEVSTSSLCF